MIVLIVINIKYMIGWFSKNIIKILLWGVSNLILKVLINLLVKVELIIKFGMVWIGLVVVNGIDFFVINESFIMMFVKLVFWFVLLNLFLNKCVVMKIVNGGIIFLVIIEVIIIFLLVVIVVVKVVVLNI